MTPAPQAARARAAALLLGSALALGACASAPDLGPAPTAKALAPSPASLQASPGPSSPWPADAWWRSYGDPQLTALIEEGLAGSPDMAQAQARLRRARAAAEQTGAARFPQLSASAQAAEAKDSVNNGLPAFLASDEWRETAQARLDLSFELDFWGKNRAAFRAAASDAWAAEAEAAATRLALSTAIASAYADLARLHADRDAAQDALKSRRESAELIAGRHAEGLETLAALRRAEAERAGAEGELAALDESLALTRNALAALLGEGPDRGRAIGRPAVSRLAAAGLPANLEVELIGRRPDLTASRLRAESAAQRIRVARADFYPNVRLSALVGLQSVGLGALTNAGSDFASVGPAVSLPIFSAGRLEGAYRGARADYDAAIAGYDATVVRALREVADAVASRQALARRLDRNRAALDAAEDAARLVVDRYKGGLSTYLDVLAAEDSLIAQRRAVADLEARAFSLDVALVRALGGGFRAPPSVTASLPQPPPRT
jgi:NodT family efflux transporter outer membrane factor (OMF) lipoprotein